MPNYYILDSNNNYVCIIEQPNANKVVSEIAKNIKRGSMPAGEYSILRFVDSVNFEKSEKVVVKATSANKSEPEQE